MIATPNQEQSTIVFENLPATWVIGLVIVPAILLLAWWAYLRPLIIGRKRMSGLRALLLTIAILLALDPVIRKSQQLIEPSSLIILIDNSASIGPG